LAISDVLEGIRILRQAANGCGGKLGDREMGFAAGGNGVVA
jgi:hypothetical protein